MSNIATWKELARVVEEVQKRTACVYNLGVLYTIKLIRNEERYLVWIVLLIVTSTTIVATPTVDHERVWVLSLLRKYHTTRV